MKIFLVFLVISYAHARGLERRGNYGYSRESWSVNSGRIINGEPADISQFPHMLTLLDLSYPGYFCGASIIASQWALSAAHCLHFYVPAYQIHFRAGSSNRLTGGTIFIAASYTLHPNYDVYTLAFDIAIARTTTPMSGTNIAPVALPMPCNSICCTVCENVLVTTTGWGRNEHDVHPEYLVQLTKPVHEFSDCVRIWESKGFGKIGDDVFCKGAFDGKDTCDGDSGSPLVTGTGANRIQVGVVSFGSSICADGSAPSGNVRVEQPAIRSWITSLSGI